MVVDEKIAESVERAVIKIITSGNFSSQEVACAAIAAHEAALAEAGMVIVPREPPRMIDAADQRPAMTQNDAVEHIASRMYAAVWDVDLSLDAVRQEDCRWTGETKNVKQFFRECVRTLLSSRSETKCALEFDE